MTTIADVKALPQDIMLTRDSWLTQCVNDAGVVVAYIHVHKSRLTGDHCISTIPLVQHPEYLPLIPEGEEDAGQPDLTGSWDRIQEEPLTLMPGLLCLRCAEQGWVIEGKWQTKLR